MLIDRRGSFSNKFKWVVEYRMKAEELLNIFCWKKEEEKKNQFLIF